MDRDMGRMYYTISIRAPTRGATTSPMCISLYATISIRAPTRGATCCQSQNTPCQPISIRAPTRGATQGVAARFGACRFQSALPRGERLGGIIRTAQGKGISIRAPTRGATVSKCTQRGGNVFQSALPRGERQMLLYTVACVLIFQSALPRGERLYQHFYFLRMCTISIRAPTRGATRLIDAFYDCYGISIRAPTRGATRYAFPVP